MTAEDEFDFSGKKKLGTGKSKDKPTPSKEATNDITDSGTEEGIPLDKVRIDGNTQARIELDTKRVDTLVDVLENPNIGKFDNPVIVYNDGADYWLADGFHRYHAYKKLERRKITAEVRIGTRREAFIYSRTSANQEHKGKPLTLEDKKRNAEDLLKDEEWGKLTSRKIAQVVGLHHTTVEKIRKSLSGELARCDEETRLVSRGGTTYEQKIPPKRNPAKKSSNKENITTTNVRTEQQQVVVTDENYDEPIHVTQPESVSQVEEAVSHDTEVEQEQLRVVTYTWTNDYEDHYETEESEIWGFEICSCQEELGKLKAVAETYNMTVAEMLTHALQEGLYSQYKIDLRKSKEKK